MTNYKQSAQRQTTYPLHAIYLRLLNGPPKEDAFYRRFVVEQGYTLRRYGEMEPVAVSDVSSGDWVQFVPPKASPWTRDSSVSLLEAMIKARAETRKRNKSPDDKFELIYGVFDYISSLIMDLVHRSDDHQGTSRIYGLRERISNFAESRRRTTANPHGTLTNLRRFETT